MAEGDEMPEEHDDEDMPVSQADIHGIGPLPDPPTLTQKPLPPMAGIESDDQGKMMEQSMPFSQSMPPVEKKLRQVKGPVFISLKKYKELRAGVDELKNTAAQLKVVLGRLKDNRDSGFELLEKSTDSLLKLEEQSESVNNLLKN